MELQCTALVAVTWSHFSPSAALRAQSQPFSSSPMAVAAMAKQAGVEIDDESSAPVPEAGRLQRGEVGGCALCLYRWATPNPVKNRSEKQPLLGRKSPRSWYCSPCTSNVHCNWASETCVSLQEKLANGMVSQSDYDETRKKYLAGVNGEGPRCRRENKGASRQKVQTEKSKGLKFSRNCGVLWEVAAWNAAVEDPRSPAYQQPAAKEAETMVVSVSDDHKVTGVLREKSFGEPMGTWTVSEEMMKTLRLVADAVDSKEEADGPEVAWAAASKRKLVSLDPVDVGTEEEPRSSKTLKVFTPSTKRDPGDFCALDDLFLDSGKKSGAPARRAVLSRQELVGIAKGCTTRRQWYWVPGNCCEMQQAQR